MAKESTNRIGIISGSGPRAGLDVFTKILDEHQANMGDSYKSDKDAPAIVMYQVPEIGGPHGSWDLEDTSTPEYKKLWNGLTKTLVSPPIRYFTTVLKLYIYSGRFSIIHQNFFKTALLNFYLFS